MELCGPNLVLRMHNEVKVMGVLQCYIWLGFLEKLVAFKFSKGIDIGLRVWDNSSQKGYARIRVRTVFKIHKHVDYTRRYVCMLMEANCCTGLRFA